MQANISVDDFLQTLGLEKYSITFQAEEVCFYFFIYVTSLNDYALRFECLKFFLFMQVDMTALAHMTDEDLKAIGIPMVNLMKFSALTYFCNCFIYEHYDFLLAYEYVKWIKLHWVHRLE